MDSSLQIWIPVSNTTPYRSTELGTTMQNHLPQNDACTGLYHRLINLLSGRWIASVSKHGPRKGSGEKPNYCFIFAAGIAYVADVREGPILMNNLRTKDDPTNPSEFIHIKVSGCCSFQ